jgi:hypothetical protein
MGAIRSLGVHTAIDIRRSIAVELLLALLLLLLLLGVLLLLLVVVERGVRGLEVEAGAGVVWTQDWGRELGWKRVLAGWIELGRSRRRGLAVV